MKKNQIGILCAQETMNMDSSFFWRDEIAIITATSLTLDDKSKIRKAKGSGKGVVGSRKRIKTEQIWKKSSGTKSRQFQYFDVVTFKVEFPPKVVFPNPETWVVAVALPRSQPLIS